MKAFVSGHSIDKLRTLPSGRKRWVGKVLSFDGSDKTRRGPEIVAVVYADTLAEMRRRKWAIVAALTDSASSSP